ncbi:3-hydroxyacyl-CoA dehydrogenase [Brachybacterium phenoliresistens]|uniref:3-hydroxyacyl-CoA dehydrogenase n=1 Tax=Brachybacterium phenoliresistens TaxID=396014 RepID=Z9JR11_9MICO|nr:3-hydroxyacyl-CoA dehydrogenase NAD-binding domain-containing protein [Brachybacterium phenoliresistens]EWS80458.1 3-hydroxyacyl-CoA dehydrogenase [Brachybacterium phenoliresistens]
MSAYTEHVTRVLVEDVDHPALGAVAVLRFAPAEGSTRPATLGPRSVDAVVAAVGAALDRAEAGEIGAIAMTGQGRVFLAGADLAMFADATATEAVGPMTAAVHALQLRVRTSAVPILAHLGGVALGGGLEVALMADVRTAAPGVRGIGLPETSLGILPGWGGTTLLQSVVGAETAARMILEDPARDRQLSAEAALEAGLVDALAEDLPAALDAFAAILWERGLLPGGEESIARPSPLPAAGSEAAAALEAALAAPHGHAETRRGWADRLAAQGAPAVQRAADLLARLPGSSLEDALAREAAALVELIGSDGAAGSLYAAELLRRGKPSRTPVEGARELRSVGVAGAGLMASQIAAQLAAGLQVPVILRDLDADIAQKGLEHARGILEKAGAGAAAPLLSATDAVEDLAGCDLVLEAVPEVMRIKQQVLAELEAQLAPTAILASNTSSLSLATMAEHLEHPERVVGLHFFNPVAKMPLVEVIHTAATDEAALATGLEVVRRLRKFAVRSADAPGFIVNRLLFRVLGEVFASLDAGADPQQVDASLDPMGMPMRPLALLDLVGHAVADHVGRVLAEELGERFHASPGLSAMVERGEPFTERDPASPHPAVRPVVAEVFAGASAGSDGGAVGQDLLDRVRDGLAEEIRRMLEEGVVQDVSQIDLALILGAGFPRYRGGITVHLDQCGASQRAGGGPFHGSRFQPA